MLIVFPIGRWIFSFVCDLVYPRGSANNLLSTAGGVVGALLAAIPGFIDYRDNHRSRVKLDKS